MPRYMRASATNVTIATANVQADAAERAVREPRREQEREAAVDRDRGCRVTGRVAGVDRQILETGDARPMRVDDERRDAIRRRLDAEREHDERRESPLRAATAQTNAIDPATIGSTTPPAMIEPTSEASVPDGDPMCASQTSNASPDAPGQACSITRVTRNPQPIESAGDRRQPDEHHDDEDDRGMHASEGVGQPLGRPPPRVRRGRERRSRSVLRHHRGAGECAIDVFSSRSSGARPPPTVARTRATGAPRVGVRPSRGQRPCQFCSYLHSPRPSAFSPGSLPGAIRGSRRPAAPTLDTARKVGVTVGKHPRAARLPRRAARPRYRDRPCADASRWSSRSAAACCSACSPTSCGRTRT